MEFEPRCLNVSEVSPMWENKASDTDVQQETQNTWLHLPQFWMQRCITVLYGTGCFVVRNLLMQKGKQLLANAVEITFIFNLRFVVNCKLIGAETVVSLIRLGNMGILFKRFKAERENNIHIFVGFCAK